MALATVDIDIASTNIHTSAVIVGGRRKRVYAGFGASRARVGQTSTTLDRARRWLCSKRRLHVDLRVSGSAGYESF